MEREALAAHGRHEPEAELDRAGVVGRAEEIDTADGRAVVRAPHEVGAERRGVAALANGRTYTLRSSGSSVKA